MKRPKETIAGVMVRCTILPHQAAHLTILGATSTGSRSGIIAHLAEKAVKLLQAKREKVLLRKKDWCVVSWFYSPNAQVTICYAHERAQYV